jgi:hypothetical protein
LKLKLHPHIDEITVHSVKDHPEMAALAILDSALHAASLALDVAHPEPWWSEVEDDEIRPHEPPCPCCFRAQNIVYLAAELRNAIDDYRPGREPTRQLKLISDIPPGAPF